jgi:oligoendopeptidase F
MIPNLQLPPVPLIQCFKSSRTRLLIFNVNYDSGDSADFNQLTELTVHPDEAVRKDVIDNLFAVIQLSTRTTTNLEAGS